MLFSIFIPHKIVEKNLEDCRRIHHHTIVIPIVLSYEL